jgi:hypothetical protein
MRRGHRNPGASRRLGLKKLRYFFFAAFFLAAGFFAAFFLAAINVLPPSFVIRTRWFHWFGICFSW